MATIVYSDDSEPGITRKKVRHGWGYWDADGQAHHRPRRDRPAERDRPAPRLSRRLVLPQAQRPYPGDRLGREGPQAISLSPRFPRERRRRRNTIAAPTSAARCPSCARGSRTTCKQRGVSRKERAVAAIVRLLDLGHIRVGNEAYAKANKSFGATTLRNRHAEVDGQHAEAPISRASRASCAADDHRRGLARFVKKCQDLPGQHLFQYVDDDGEPHPVTSSDVNDYIREATGDDFTAKHFRTWGASVLAFEALAGGRRATSA